MNNFFAKIGKAIKNEVVDFGRTFARGDWKTWLSVVIMGAGNFLRGQIVKGLAFLAAEAGFIFYMWYMGLYYLSMLPSLGIEEPGEKYDEVYDTYVQSYGDNSFQILLYGVLTIIVIAAIVVIWRLNLKSAFKAQQMQKEGKKLPKFKDDLHSLIDEKFYKTLLALPLTGIILFTVLPLIFMILVAFTNYDGTHDGYFTQLFHWQGWANFKTLFAVDVEPIPGTLNYKQIFFRILGWTVIWAFFATFTNYFLGIIVALMINKKGIKFKKLWRTILVLTIAIPQFISLLYVSKMFDKSGLINGFLVKSGLIQTAFDFWGKKTAARILVIVINIWIGIPYLMLISTGILMNIPADLYESARIDGATPFQQFIKITMPYMLFITGPYLLTSFTGNMNNFNVIFLLSGGGPTNAPASAAAGSVGYTDLLITWLFKITTGTDSKYYLASVIGILIFVVVSVITLIVYNLLPSNRNEGDFS